MKRRVTFAALLMLCAASGASAAIVDLGHYVLVQADASVTTQSGTVSAHESQSSGSPGSRLTGPIFVGNAEATKTAPSAGQVGRATGSNTAALYDLSGMSPAYTVTGQQSAEGTPCFSPAFCVPDASTNTELHIYFRVADAPEDVTFTYDFVMTSTGDPTRNQSLAESTLLYDAGFELPAQTPMFSLLTSRTESGAHNPNGSVTVSLPVGDYRFSFLQQAASHEVGGSISSAYDLNLHFAATPVPLPAAAWLLLSGISGVALFARRRRNPDVASNPLATRK